MDITWIISLVSVNLVTAVILILAFAVDKDGIINMMKLKFRKGYGLIIIIGKDKKLYMTTSKISGKAKETEQISVNELPYNLNRKKIVFYKTYPVLIFDEGISEPLAITSGELSYGKATPELISQMIILARRSGQIPGSFDKNQKLMFYLTVASAIASGIAVWLLMQQGDQITAIKSIASAIKNIVGGA